MNPLSDPVALLPTLCTYQMSQVKYFLGKCQCFKGKGPFLGVGEMSLPT